MVSSSVASPPKSSVLVRENRPPSGRSAVNFERTRRDLRHSVDGSSSVRIGWSSSGVSVTANVAITTYARPSILHYVPGVELVRRCLVFRPRPSPGGSQSIRTELCSSIAAGPAERLACRRNLVTNRRGRGVSLRSIAPRWGPWACPAHRSGQSPRQ